MKAKILLLLILLATIGHASAFSGGSGTEGDPWQIATLNDLQGIGASSATLSGHYIQTADIDASSTVTWNGGNGFIPIGYYSDFEDSEFSGVYNGNGYKITDLYIDTSQKHAGLFGALFQATVTNVRLVDIDFTSNADYSLGGLVGYCDNSIVSGCGVTGTVTGTGGLDDIGGVVAIVDEGTLSSCYFIGDVVIEDSGNNAGGFAGWLFGDCDISNCYARGNLTTDYGGYAGGFTGRVSEYTTSIDNCYSAMVITDIGDSNTGVGAFMGYIAELSEGVDYDVSYCYYDTSIDGLATPVMNPDSLPDSGGLYGESTTNMQTQSTYSGWDFLTTWKMSDYPILFQQVEDAPLHLSPGNESINYIAPPLLHSVELEAYMYNADYYNLVVATDSGYSFPVYQATPESPGISTYKKSINLEKGTYYYKVEAYDTSNELIGSGESIFTITETFDLNSTSVAGNVYEIENGLKSFIPYSTVTIYNNTWSDTYTTDSGGYYQFVNLTAGQTYAIEATKNGYEPASTNVITAIDTETITKHIILDKSVAPTFIQPHDVKFTVTNYISVFSDVAVSVYEGDESTAAIIGTTGDDGSVTFELSETSKYRISFVSVAQGIDREWTGYPVDSSYKVIVFSSSPVPEDREIEDILFGVATSSVNMTHSNITSSYEDTSGTTILAELWIRDDDENQLYYFSSTNTSDSFSQTVEAGNSTYIVEFKITNNVLDDPLTVFRTIHFGDGVRFDLGFENGWNYVLISCALLIGVGALFTYVNAETGGVVVSLMGWVLYYMGWLTAGFTETQEIAMGLFMLFGTLIAFGAAIKAGESRTS